MTDDDAMMSLGELAAAGYVTDGWETWQQGRCGTYACALIMAHPELRLGALGTMEDPADIDAGWSLLHFFAHDGRHAYDSAGRHELPYRGVHAQADYCELDGVPGWYGLPDEEAGPEGSDYWLELASSHAERHGIGPGREVTA